MSRGYNPDGEPYNEAEALGSDVYNLLDSFLEAGVDVTISMWEENGDGSDCHILVHEKRGNRLFRIDFSDVTDDTDALGLHHRLLSTQENTNA